MTQHTDPRCEGCELLTEGGECSRGVTFGEEGCKHFCPPEECDLFEEMDLDPAKTFHVLTLEEYRAFRKRGAAPLVLEADGFTLRLEKNVYPPDAFDELTRIMAALMWYELRLFEE